MSRKEQTNRWTYRSNCTQNSASVIDAMAARSREITRRTFLEYVDRESLVEFEAELGYAPHPSQGLTMAGDAYVRYYRSVYRTRTCVYVDHSSVLYIFY